jgi:hypothetical protein
MNVQSLEHRMQIQFEHVDARFDRMADRLARTGLAASGSAATP